jgi:hypothetical protein
VKSCRWNNQAAAFDLFFKWEDSLFFFGRRFEPGTDAFFDRQQKSPIHAAAAH